MLGLFCRVVSPNMFLISKIRTEGFKIYPGFCIYSCRVTPTDQEIIAIEESFLLRVLESRGQAPQYRDTGKHWRWLRGRSGGIPWAPAFPVVSVGKTSEAG